MNLCTKLIIRIAIILLIIYIIIFIYSYYISWLIKNNFRHYYVGPSTVTVVWLVLLKETLRKTLILNPRNKDMW